MTCLGDGNARRWTLKAPQGMDTCIPRAWHPPPSLQSCLLPVHPNSPPHTHQQQPHPRLTISYLARERSLWNRSNSRRSWMVTSSFQSASRMMPISTTLPITASTMVTALGAELQAGSEGEKLISSGVSVSQIRILGCNNLDCSH